FVSQVAVGKLECLNVWGNDYPTPDGTGVRDYIHVVDLARGHLAALQVRGGGGVRTYNLGSGRGYSVMEMIGAFERASGRQIKYRNAPRRPGDVASCYADPSLAQAELGWSARLDLDAMCRDAWNWQSRNPLGYRG
ncbi:MAG: GDP-mannose 4,6-dehydratase, partial [Pseudomonadales bacterium]